LKAVVEHLDVLIVGAGISGVCAAHGLHKSHAEKTYAIFESRSDLGGTWDLFRYPGIRSDSDMYTLGYSFKPWDSASGIANGGDIKAYIRETAEENGITQKIRYGHQVKSAAWSSELQYWTVIVERDGAENITITCTFLLACSGYYDYEKGYTPDFPGREEFSGNIVHPQEWDDSVDYTDKRVVLIGSGATAITLLPAMAQKAKHVTMLQRSPTYIVSMQSTESWMVFLKKYLPGSWAYSLVRAKHIFATTFWGVIATLWPKRFAALLIAGVRQAMGPDFDVKRHFVPRYLPWQQRVCMAPEGDFFEVLKNGRASIVTDQIEKFTRRGVLLASGQELDADLIVTATGLNLKVLGGINLSVDGRQIDLGEATVYKGMMFSGVPNLVAFTGYTGASWTLKIEITASYISKLFDYMKKQQYESCTPILADSDSTDGSAMSLSSGYVKRAKHLLPKQGKNWPWKIHDSYLLDRQRQIFNSINDGVLSFERSGNAT
jgi:monooxygenase